MGPCFANLSWYFRTLTGHATFFVYTDVYVTESVGVSVLPLGASTTVQSLWVLCAPFWETIESLGLWKLAFSQGICRWLFGYLKKIKCIIYLFILVSQYSFVMSACLKKMISFACIKGGQTSLREPTCQQLASARSCSQMVWRVYGRAVEEVSGGGAGRGSGTSGILLWWWHLVVRYLWHPLSSICLSTCFMPGSAMPKPLNAFSNLDHYCRHHCCAHSPQGKWDPRVHYLHKYWQRVNSQTGILVNVLMNLNSSLFFSPSPASPSPPLLHSSALVIKTKASCTLNKCSPVELYTPLIMMLYNIPKVDTLCSSWTQCFWLQHPRWVLQGQDAVVRWKSEECQYVYNCDPIN